MLLLELEGYESDKVLPVLPTLNPNFCKLFSNFLHCQHKRQTRHVLSFLARIGVGVLSVLRVFLLPLVLLLKTFRYCRTLQDRKNPPLLNLNGSSGRLGSMLLLTQLHTCQSLVDEASACTRFAQAFRALGFCSFVCFVLAFVFERIYEVRLALVFYNLLNHP